MHIRTPIGIAFLLAALWMLAPAFAGEDTAPRRNAVAVLTIDGPIGPATADYLVRGIEKSARAGHEAAVIQMDTPGGLVKSTRDINKAILNADIPVITFVYPSGARAASAGTFILYASHVAAMAPASNVGAATPVSMGGAPPPGEKPAKEPGEKKGGENGEGTGDGNGQSGKPAPRGSAGKKAVNDAVAYIRSLAEKRGRNADWAERAVREAESITADVALDKNVIDLIARDIGELLGKLDGRAVETASGNRTLATKNARLERMDPDWRTELLAVITSPTVAYLLLLIGIYGLLFEGYNPGAIVPGVVGAISLLLALYAMQALPVNYAGLALVALGIILMVSEAFVPSFGALGIGGVVSFVFGSVILMDTDVPGFAIPMPLIVTISTLGALMVLAILWFVMQSRRAPVVSGREEMVGNTGRAMEDFQGRGRIRIHSEIWNAWSDAPVRKDETVRVLRMEGLVLHVEPETGPETGQPDNAKPEGR